jgi:hypothetical protein
VTALPCGHFGCSLCVARACINSANASACLRCSMSFDYVECRTGAYGDCEAPRDGVRAAALLHPTLQPASRARPE